MVVHVPVHDQQKFWNAAESAGVDLVLCGHVHRAGWSGTDGLRLACTARAAEWAGRTIAWYELTDDQVTMEVETAAESC